MSLKDLLQECTSARQQNAETMRQNAESERASWLSRSVAWNLKRVEDEAKAGSGWCGVVGVNGVDDQMNPQFEALVAQLRKEGKVHGFTIQSPYTMSSFPCIYRYLIVWDSKGCAAYGQRL